MRGITAVIPGTALEILNYRRDGTPFLNALFKRDYARIRPNRDAAAVIEQLSTWIEDYIEARPYKGLRMLSPHEFIRVHSRPAPCPI